MIAGAEATVIYPAPRGPGEAVGSSRPSLVAFPTGQAFRGLFQAEKMNRAPIQVK